MMKTNDKKGITLIALVITIIVLLILAGVSIATLTGNNGILTQAQNAKQLTEENTFNEKVNLILIQAKMNKNNDKDATTNLEDAFKTEDKNASVTKINFVYEVTFEGKQLLVSDDYKYIEKVEPKNKNDWKYTEEGTITAYHGDDSNVIIPNYIDGVRIKSIRVYWFE